MVVCSAMMPPEQALAPNAYRPVAVVTLDTEQFEHRAFYNEAEGRIEYGRRERETLADTISARREELAQLRERPIGAYGISILILCLGLRVGIVTYIAHPAAVMGAI